MMNHYVTEYKNHFEVKFAKENFVIEKEFLQGYAHALIWCKMMCERKGCKNDVILEFLEVASKFLLRLGRESKSLEESCTRCASQKEADCT